MVGTQFGSSARDADQSNGFEEVMIISKHVLDIASLGYCRLGIAGLSPIMPGTCGSFLAALLAPFLFLPLSFWGRVAVLAFVFWSGALAATRVEHLMGCKDPGSIVIDELVGVWIALLPFKQPGWVQIMAAFLLFRLFDIWKPWPVHASENWLPDGYGVMLDDAVAGLMALIVLALFSLLGIF